jgi:segregation and condensation protein B
MTEEQKAIINNQQHTQEPEIQPESEKPAPEQTESEDTITEQPQPVLRSESEGGTTDLPPGVEPTVESVVEAVLFASDEPISTARLAEIVGTNVKQLRKHVDDLNAKYKLNNNAFQIEQIAGGYQMLTLSIYSHWLKKLIRARDDSKLSQPALETLAIIAYKQPIIRADVEAIRGVAAGEMIRNLMYKGLVKITGRAEVVGRPLLYGTTKKFLEVFGLNCLKDLPKAEELKKPE